MAGWGCSQRCCHGACGRAQVRGEGCDWSWKCVEEGQLGRIAMCPDVMFLLCDQHCRLLPCPTSFRWAWSCPLILCSASQFDCMATPKVFVSDGLTKMASPKAPRPSLAVCPLWLGTPSWHRAMPTISWDPCCQGLRADCMPVCDAGRPWPTCVLMALSIAGLTSCLMSQSPAAIAGGRAFVLTVRALPEVTGVPCCTVPHPQRKALALCTAPSAVATC